MDLDSTEKLLSASALVFGGLIFLWKKVIKKWIAKLKKLRDYINRITNALDRIKFIESELKPNGGGSIKDVVNKIQKGLIKLEGTHYSLLSVSEKPMFETDVQGNCIWANNAYCRLVQRSFDELRGHGWRVILHEDDEESVMEKWNYAIEEGIDFHHKYRYVKSDGSVALVKCNAYRIRNSHGENLGYMGFVEEAK